MSLQIHNGAILIDKASGMTSHDVVARLRKIYDTKAVGHAGTLDPIATGLLICLLGEATKLSNYVMSEKKSYRVGIKFGVRTDSGDISGKTVEEKTPPPFTQQDLEEKVKLITGEVLLPVPKYSAVKIAGKKLYEYARENIEVEVPVKAMHIHTAHVVECGPGFAIVDIECEKGTYVRSWAERLGELMGCGATVGTLRRMKSGPFDLRQAISIESLALLSSEEQSKRIIPLSDVLAGWPALVTAGRDQVLIRNGQIPKSIFSQVLSARLRDQGVRCLTDSGELLALIVTDPQKGLKLARVFNGQNK